MTTVDDALGWANRIDERLGPISGADADRLARFLRRMAEEMRDEKPARVRLLNELARFFAEFSNVALKEGPSVAGVYADVSAFCRAAADRDGWIG